MDDLTNGSGKSHDSGLNLGSKVNGNHGLFVNKLVKDESVATLKPFSHDTCAGATDKSVANGHTMSQETKTSDSKKDNFKIIPSNDILSKQRVETDTHTMIDGGTESMGGASNPKPNHGTKDLRNKYNDGNHPNCETQVSKVTLDSLSRPSYLNENELLLLSDYLKKQTETLTDTLDEDDLSSFINKTERIATERANFRQPPTVFPASDSEDEGYDSKNRQIYQEEINYIMKNNFFKEMVNETNASKFDKKTMNWLRKSIGLSRRTELQDTVGRRFVRTRDQTDESLDENELCPNASKRLTRGMARTSRIRKREERESRENQGITALLEAIEEQEASGLLLHKEDGKSATTKSITSEGNFELIIDIPNGKIGSSKRTQIHTRAPLKSNKRPRSEQRIVKKKLASTDDTELSGIVLISKWKNEKQKGLSSHNRRRKLEIKVSSIIVAEINILPQLQKNIQECHDNWEQCNSIKRPRIYHPYSEEIVQFVEPSTNRNKKRRKNFECKKKKVSSKEELAKIDNNSSRIKLGIHTKLVPFDAQNSTSGQGHDPIVTYQAKKKHTNSFYASLCSRLLNCLNSGGRSFARYEFFYSDIDRPWFNFNYFELDLCKLGIPTDTKLTRTEWSLVRQQIRKRPRRFSRNFVNQEVERLKDYRSIVRKMQHMGMPRPKGFLFEVPRAIEVGTVVTAFCKKYHILHRGMVLDYDFSRRMYLIQFERKELGFEFCPDVEVASHGVPQLFTSCDTLALDGSPIGCFADSNNQHGDPEYGTCHSSTQNLKQNAKKNDQAKPMSASEVVQFDSTSQNPKGLLESAEYSESAEQIVEQQIVIKLIETIERCLDRKSQLLNAIDELNYVVSLQKKNKESSKQLPTQLADHYAWLLANLDVTSKSLQAAMSYSQIMYTNPCTNISALGLKESIPVKKAVKSTLRLGHVSPDVYAPWVSALLSHCAREASAIEMKVDATDSKKDSSRQSLSAQLHCEKFLNNRCNQALKLLLCSNYISANPTLFENSDASVEKAIETAFSVCLKDLESPELDDNAISTNKDTIDLNAFESRRLQAMEDLALAVRTFQTELTLDIGE